MSRLLLADVAVCVFDLYGTLANVDRIADHVRADLGPDADLLVALARRKQLEYTWLRTIMGRHTDFWHITGESLDFAFAQMGMVNPSLRSRLMEAWLAPTLYPDAGRVVTRIQEAGIKTAILSNGSPSMLVGGLAAAGASRWFDAVLSVEPAGVYKPHPSAYALVTSHFHVEPKAVCFVSSNGWDVAGSAAFGFRAVAVNRSGAPREVLPAAPAAEIAELGELPDILGLT